MPKSPARPKVCSIIDAPICSESKAPGCATESREVEVQLSTFGGQFLSSCQIAVIRRSRSKPPPKARRTKCTTTFLARFAMTLADRDITLGTVGIRKLPTYGIGQISIFYNFAIPHHRPLSCSTPSPRTPRYEVRRRKAS